jgi:hypothetical protein
LRVDELIMRLLNAKPDSVVLYLDSYACVDESDEVVEIFVDSNVWAYETGARYGENYEVRYPGSPRPSDEEKHVVTAQSVERVVVLSNGPTNLRYVVPFKPNEREQELTRRAFASHRRAQAFRRYAPSRLVNKWTSENSLAALVNRPTKGPWRRFKCASRLSRCGLTRVPLVIRHAVGMAVGARLYWGVTPDGQVSISVMPSRRRERSNRDNA